MINIRSIHTLLLSVFFTALLFSCSNKSIENAAKETNQSIIISKKQFAAEKMKLGKSQMHTFKKTFKTNGILTAAPKSKAYVYSYFSGTVKQINVTPGNYVRQGQILLSIVSKEFINLQRQYLEALAQQKASKADYKRVKELYKEKITSQKDYFEVESQYETLNAKIQALKAELKIAQININNLENGNISSYLSIKSPINGYVSDLKCTTGKFIVTESMLLKVIDNSNLQLHFFVYQETVGNLQKGQKITIYSADNPDKTYSAIVISIGKSIDPETKSIRCIAKPEPALKKIFVDGMYFQVEVVTDTMEAQALPSEAIIESGNAYFVLVKEKEDDENLYFKKTSLKTGISDDTDTQIIEDKALQNVLVKGTYYF